MEALENEILEKTIFRVIELYGGQFDQIKVTRAVLGLFFFRRKAQHRSWRTLLYTDQGNP
jgi:hypothetical protein